MAFMCTHLVPSSSLSLTISIMSSSAKHIHEYTTIISPYQNTSSSHRFVYCGYSTNSTLYRPDHRAALLRLPPDTQAPNVSWTPSTEHALNWISKEFCACMWPYIHLLSLILSCEVILSVVYVHTRMHTMTKVNNRGSFHIRKWSGALKR